MTTALEKPIARAVTIGDTRYKVILSQDGVRLTEHKKRRGIEIFWASLISLIDTDGKEGDTTNKTSGTGVPQSITNDVAKEIRAAAAALARADDSFRAAGILPPEVLAEISSDPFHQRPKSEPDWFIEPLLTGKEVASILRLPIQSIRGLGITSVRIAGEERFRQSVVRAYLIEQENQSSRATFSPPQSSSGAARQTTHPQARRFKSYYNKDR